MIITPDSHLYQSIGNAPKTFANLMDLYERNYIGVRRLSPELAAAGTTLISKVDNGLSLYLHIFERFRYTSEIALTYYFTRGQQPLAQPNLRIRVYHDARLAEVQSAQLRHDPPFFLDEQLDQSHLVQRWRVNRFLYKWLNFCLYQGHQFQVD